MTTIQRIMYANLEEPRSRNRDLETPNLRKKCCMRTRFEGAQSRDSNFRGQKSPKVENFKPVNLGNYQH